MLPIAENHPTGSNLSLFYKNCCDFRMRTIITNPSLLMPFLDLFAALCGNGMLESMLEPHLKFAGAGTVAVGVSFLVFGCCYMLGNVLFGGVSMNIQTYYMKLFF